MDDYADVREQEKKSLVETEKKLRYALEVIAQFTEEHLDKHNERLIRKIAVKALAHKPWRYGG